jgi:hypothetical protein
MQLTEQVCIDDVLLLHSCLLRETGTVMSFTFRTKLVSRSCPQLLPSTIELHEADVKACGFIIASHSDIRLTMLRRKPVLATTQSSHSETYVKL